MDLIAEVNQKNNLLLSKRVELQQCLDARINTPYFSSFLIAFVLAPFFAGVVARFSLGPTSELSYQLYRAIFARWRP